MLFSFRDRFHLLTENKVTVIAASNRSLVRQLSAVWQFRELVYFLMWRDVKIRYKQTILGIAWAIIQPVMTMIVFSLFFGNLAKIPSDDVPYPLFSYAALVPWTFFANGIIQSSNSIIANANMIKKIYFPRLIIPIASILPGLIDALLAFSVLALLMIAYGFSPTPNIIYLPYFVLIAIATSLGVGLWLSALNVQFRDIRYTLPFITQLWLFLTPIAYPSSLLDEPWRTLYGINPMTGVVEGFRWALLGTDPAPGNIIIVSSLITFVLLASGILYFTRTERIFADIA